MGQKGFFDVEHRQQAISAKAAPLETIKKIVAWEDFRADIEAVTETKPEERKSNAGRKPYDAILLALALPLVLIDTKFLLKDLLSTEFDAASYTLAAVTFILLAAVVASLIYARRTRDSSPLNLPARPKFATRRLR